jgi:hypothetical protein
VKNVHATRLVTAAVVAGVISAFAVAGAAAAADPEISGEGHVTLDFASTPGSVNVQVWTHNLSTVEAYGAARVIDVDGTAYDFGPKLYAAGEQKTYTKTLSGYTCADLGRGAVAFAFGFASLDQTEPDWIGAPLRYPDPRITVIGCDPVVTPTDGGTTTPPAQPPVVTPGATTPAATTPTASTGTNTVPAAKTDGAEIARSTSSPLFGFAVTLGAVLAAAVGARVTGVLKRR